MELIKPEKLTYSVPEAAKALGISVTKMYQIIRMEGFPVVTLGSRHLIPIKGLERWLEAQTPGGCI